MTRAKNDRARADCARTLHARSNTDNGLCEHKQNRINLRLRLTTPQRPAQASKSQSRARARTTQNEISQDEKVPAAHTSSVETRARHIAPSGGWRTNVRRPEVTPVVPIAESPPRAPLVSAYPWSSASRLRFISRDTLCWAASCRASSVGTFDTGLFDISVELTRSINARKSAERIFYVNSPCFRSYLSGRKHASALTVRNGERTRPKQRTLLRHRHLSRT